MGAPGLTVYLPPAITVGDRVGVRAQPNNPAGLSGVVVEADDTDTINGAPDFTVAAIGYGLPYWGSCFTFVVGVARDGPVPGDWWVESCYLEAYVE